ncbi:MAG: leucine-rich repeat domain-containing protein [Clostridia bacterium]|nr:leucine-rich repeat domain-containing protein [Clostridia bacterium]
MNHVFQDLILIENEQDVAVKQSNDVAHVTIPKQFNGKPVTAINNWAFAGSIKLESVVIPDTVTTIYGNAFAGCMSLKQVIIPKSVCKIDPVVFAGCENITIYCEAESKPENWSAIWNSWERPVYWYSENEPKNSGNFWHYVNGAPKKW